MKMRLALAIACLTIVGSTAAQAASYNLTTDYSNTANPNGAWSYNYAGNPLAHQTGPTTANPLNPAIPPGGYFSTGSDLNTNTPDKPSHCTICYVFVNSKHMPSDKFRHSLPFFF